MNKPAKPQADDFDDLSDLYGGPPPTEAEMDAWIAANLDEINASLREARQELAEGKTEPWTMDDIMAEVREELRKEGR
jgi:antitoxin ParD1/3/4